MCQQLANLEVHVCLLLERPEGLVMSCNGAVFSWKCYIIYVRVYGFQLENFYI